MSYDYVDVKITFRPTSNRYAGLLGEKTGERIIQQVDSELTTMVCHAHPLPTTADELYEAVYTPERRKFISYINANKEMYGGGLPESEQLFLPLANDTDRFTMGLTFYNDDRVWPNWGAEDRYSRRLKNAQGLFDELGFTKHPLYQRLHAYATARHATVENATHLKKHLQVILNKCRTLKQLFVTWPALEVFLTKEVVKLHGNRKPSFGKYPNALLTPEWDEAYQSDKPPKFRPGEHLVGWATPAALAAHDLILTQTILFREHDTETMQYKISDSVTISRS